VPRETVLGNVATELEVMPAELEASLYADLAGERRVMPLSKELSPGDFAIEANLAIVTGLLRRAARLRVRAWGNTRALVRQARLSGLICTLSRAEVSTSLPKRPKGAAELDLLGPTEPGVTLDVSGPFALFRHTEIYGRALAALVPRAAWCNAFEIDAECSFGRGSGLSRVLVCSGDPIGVGRELAQYDSRLERRFANDFGRAAPDWDLIREPSPVEAEGTLIFPDFELVHRRDPARRWLLEIVGFWTRKYLEEKFQRLRAAGLERLILCVDEARACQDEELPEHAKVVRFRRRVDPKAVLAIVQGASRATRFPWS
jgi:predicted nuclease of restriction endonuclease-like RecB superfamily